VNEKTPDADEECALLHEKDEIACFTCGWTGSGKTFSDRLQKRKDKQSLTVLYEGNQEPTDEELKIISALKKLEKTFPSSLWLCVSGDSGNFLIMKKGPDGQRVMTDFGIPDIKYALAAINIESDASQF
jgi:hypothetical protein